MSTRVLHCGNAYNGPGGISGVIRRHLARNLPGLQPQAITTYEPSRRGPKKHLSMLRALWHILQASPKSTLIHIHLADHGSVLREGVLVLASKARGHRSLVTLHGATTADIKGLEALGLRVILKSANIVHGFGVIYRDHLRITPGKWRTIPNDVDIPAEMATSTNRNVLFCGEIGLRKGVDTLLTAWSTLCDDFPEWTLTLAGESTEEGRRLLAKDGHPSVRYLGRLDAVELRGQYLGSSILVLPSRAEAFPMAICEALASGLAVVATQVGATGELLDKSQQSSATPGDPRDLALKLRRLMSDTSLRARSMENARTFAVQELSGDQVDPQWESAYEDLRRK